MSAETQAKSASQGVVDALREQLEDEEEQLERLAEEKAKV